ncbi:MAG TPA: 30S ribosomal protein S16 [Candidatus Pacearchaeota archaeon]|nr:30S ribosomal protein S16 [Candidatus Pacearchaeota archaeon]
MIRLFRTGKKKQPSYKMVVTDKKNAPARGRFVEEVGFYNPMTKEVNISKERVVYWLGVGAQASDTVHNLLISNKVIEGEKRKVVLKRKEQPVKEEPKAVAPVVEAKPEQAPQAEVPVEEIKTEETQTEETKPEEAPAE